MTTTQLYRTIPDLKNAVVIPEDGIVSRTIYQDEHLKAVLFGFAPGQELSEHTASMPAIMHFIQGTAQVTVGGEKMPGQEGLWVHMNAHVSHSVLADTPVVMLLLLLKSGKAGASAGGGHC